MIIRCPDTYIAYVLVLEDGKLYVGITKEIARRYLEHKSGAGAAFTHIHRPLGVVYYQETGTSWKPSAEALKHEITVRLISRYGVENVRGADFCQINTERRNTRERVNYSWYSVKPPKNMHQIIDKNINGLLSGRLKADVDGSLINVTTNEGAFPSKTRKNNFKNKANFWWEKESSSGGRVIAI